MDEECVSAPLYGINTTNTRRCFKYDIKATHLSELNESCQWTYYNSFLTKEKGVMK